MAMSLPMPPLLHHAARRAWRDEVLAEGTRAVPEETAVALTYNGTTQAVMMASPADLEDFALGFSLTERLISSPADIESLDIVVLPEGIEARLWVSEACNRRLAERRRMMAGPTGCGLCGVDSLAEVLPPLPLMRAATRFTAASLMVAMASLRSAQPLHRETRAVHAAGLWTQGRGLAAAREDLGRHNAMDKLVGATVNAGIDPADGICLVTSRVSVEIVQKAAILGAPVLMAVSAPTALAIRTAKAAGLTLAAVGRDDGFELFTAPERIVFPA